MFKQRSCLVCTTEEYCSQSQGTEVVAKEVVGAFDYSDTTKQCFGMAEGSFYSFCDFENHINIFIVLILVNMELCNYCCINISEVFSQ